MLLDVVNKIEPLLAESTTIDAKAVDKLGLTKLEKDTLLRGINKAVNYLAMKEVNAAIAAQKAELADLIGVSADRIEIKEDGSWEVKPEEVNG